MMEAKSGVATMILYDVKTALDNLKRSSPVSLRTSQDGAQPLLNLPRVTSKPAYDAARSRHFEQTVRTRAQNPNDVMVKRHLRKFEEEGRRAMELFERERAEARAAAERELARSRDDRAERRRREAAFKESWDALGEAQWRQSKEKAASARAMRARHIANQAERSASRKAAAQVRFASAVAKDLDDFEGHLEHRAVRSVHSVAGETYQEDEQRCCPPPKVELAADFWPEQDSGNLVGDAPAPAPTPKSAMDHRVLDAELKEQKERMLNKKQEREKRDENYKRTVRKFFADKRAETLERHRQRFQEKLIETVTHKCKAEIELEQKLKVIAKYAERMVESRKYRESQYANRREFDMEETLRRDAVVFAADVDAYRARVEAYHIVAEIVVRSRRAATCQATTEMCLELLDGVVAVALEIAVLRAAEAPKIEGQGNQTFTASNSHASAPDRASHAVRDAFTLLSHRHAVLKLVPGPCAPSPVHAWAFYWPHIIREAEGGTVEVEMVDRVPLDVPSCPPHWPPLEPCQHKALSGEEAAEILDQKNLNEYLENAPPVWFSKHLAELELAGIDSFESVIGKFFDTAEPASVLNEEGHRQLDDDTSQYEIVEDAKRAASVAMISKRKPSVHYALGEAVIELRLCRDQGTQSLTHTRDLPPRFPIRIFLAGRTYSGKSEQAARLAARFQLKVLSIDVLVRDAIELARSIAMGRSMLCMKSDAEARMISLGREALGALRRGGQVSDRTYAELLALRVSQLATENETGCEAWKGWVVDDFPETRAQLAAFELVFTGYDASATPESRWDFASTLAEPTPKPKPRWPGLPPQTADELSYVESGADLVFIIETSVDDILRRALGRRVDPVQHKSSCQSGQLPDGECEDDNSADDGSRQDEYHLEWNHPLYDAPCKARLEPIENLAHSLACLPFRIGAHDSEAEDLKAYLARFGTLHEIVGTGGQSPDAVFGRLCPIVEQLVEKRTAEHATAAAKECVIQRERGPMLEENTHSPNVATEQNCAATTGDNCGAAQENDKAEARELNRHANTTEIQADSEVLPDGSHDDVCKIEDEVSTHLPRALGSTLAAAWDAAEDAFRRGAKAVLRECRLERRSRVASLHATRSNFALFLCRPDDRQTVWERFTQAFNAVPRAMRFEDETKAELHLRIEELRAGLWSSVEARQREANTVVESHSTDGSVERASLAISRRCGTLAQLEVDRTHAAIMLLHDYYHGLSSSDPSDDPSIGGGRGPGEIHGRLAQCCVLDDTIDAEKAGKAPKTRASKSADNSRYAVAADGRLPLPPDILGDLLTPYDSPLHHHDSTATKRTATAATTKRAANDAPSSSLFAAVARGAYEFASKWAAPAQRPSFVTELQAATWHQAALLKARIRRLEAAEKKGVEDVQTRARQLISDLSDWKERRIAAEFSIIEELVVTCQDAVERELSLEVPRNIDGIVLRLDPNSRFVPLHDSLHLTSLPHAHQSLVHADTCNPLSQPPSLPTQPLLLRNRFVPRQVERLRKDLFVAVDSIGAHNASLDGDALREIFDRLAQDLDALPLDWQDNVSQFTEQMMTTIDSEATGCAAIADVLTYISVI